MEGGVDVSEPTFPIPHELGITDTGATYANPAGMEADFDIAGIWFLAATSDDYPYQRQMAEIQKQQIDNSPYPGDNSLQGWWLRSQTDWSLGAGQEFMEPIAEDGVNRRFYRSAGVDVFTSPGNVTLLPSASAGASASTSATPIIVKVPNGYVMAFGSTVTRVVSGVASTDTARGTVTHMAVAGPNVLVCSAGYVEYAPVTGTWNLADAFTTGGPTPKAWSTKSRIMVAFADEIHEFAGTAISGVTALGPATPLFTVGDSSASVVACASTPSAILFAVNKNDGAVILSFGLDANNALPSTAAPAVVAEFPLGESLLGLASYLGTFIGVATSLGLRIAVAADGGGLRYGALLGSPVPSSGEFSAFDRFLHYPTADAGDGRGGLVRVDLSEVDDAGRPAWSTFTRVPVARSVVGSVMTGTLSGFMVSTDGSTAQSHEFGTGTGLDTGWLETSQVRFGTTETKAFDTVRVEVAGSGSVTVATVTSDGSVNTIGSVTGTSDTILRSGFRGPMVSSGLKFTLVKDGVSGPTLRTFGMRAYPTVTDRGERVALPLLNFDFEKGSLGVPEGYEGRAYERWVALQERLSSGVSIRVQEFRSGATYLAKPESCTFTQTAPPNQASGFGGIINLIVRTM